MITNAWALIKDAVSGFIEHEDLTRGAAIAYYTIFSIAPLLIIVIAIAGLAFGHDAAEGWVLASVVLRLGYSGQPLLLFFIFHAADRINRLGWRRLLRLQ